MTGIAPQKLSNLSALRAKDPAAFDASVAKIAKGGSDGNMEAVALSKKANVGVLDVLELATAGIEILAKSAGAKSLMKESSTQGSAPTFGGVGAGGTLRLKGFVGSETANVKDKSAALMDALAKFAPIPNTVSLEGNGNGIAGKMGWLMQHVGAFLINTGNDLGRDVAVNKDRFTQDEATKMLDMIKGSDPVVLAALQPRFDAHMKNVAPGRIDDGAKGPLAEIRKSFESVPASAKEVADLLVKIGNAGYDHQAGGGARRQAEAAVARLEVPLPLQKEAIEVIAKSFEGQIVRHEAQRKRDWENSPNNPSSAQYAANQAMAAVADSWRKD